MEARILAILQSIPILGGISEAASHHILHRAPSVAVQKDSFFFRENDEASSMFVLVEGRVSVVKVIDGHEYELSQLEPGDCIGELELIDLCPRAASVRALVDCRAIEISSGLLHEVYKIDQRSFAMIHMNMGREVSRRLRKLDSELVEVRAQGTDGREGTATSDDQVDELPARQPMLCKVCTKHVQPHEEHWEVWHGDVKYTVCCPICAERFRKEPQLYLVT